MSMWRLRWHFTRQSPLQGHLTISGITVVCQNTVSALKLAILTAWESKSGVRSGTHDQWRSQRSGVIRSKRLVENTSQVAALRMEWRLSRKWPEMSTNTEKRQSTLLTTTAQKSVSKACHERHHRSAGVEALRNMTSDSWSRASTWRHPSRCTRQGHGPRKQAACTKEHHRTLVRLDPLCTNSASTEYFTVFPWANQQHQRTEGI